MRIFIPLGISVASNSRVVVASFCIRMGSSSADFRGLRAGARLFLRRRLRAVLGGNGPALAVERGPHRVPRKSRALDADRILAHPGKDLELTQRGRIGGRVRLAGDQVVESLEEGFGVPAGLSLAGVRYNRTRGARGL